MEDINCWQSKFKLCEYSSKLLNLLSLSNNKVNQPVCITEVQKSIYYARKYHGKQLRKSGEPYYSHPLEVAYLFAEYTGKEDRLYYTTNLVITSVLHDTIEDTKLTKDMIARIFNESVASKVDDLTRIKIDRKITAGETVNLLFLQHKKDLLHIKLFDRLHNMRTISSMPLEKRKKIVEETFDYFILLAKCLELDEIKQELIKLYYQHLPVKPTISLMQGEKVFSFEDSSQLLSLIFQNKVSQTCNQ